MFSRSDANAPLPSVSPIESTFRDVNDISLHLVATGDPDGTLVILLHGFPEFWYEWYNYIEPFVDAGFRVLIPDQRGYNRSAKPGDVRNYRISELSQDILDLIATEGREAAHVIGHDWGAAVGWDLALRHPNAVNRLCIINLPHPTVFEQAIRSNLTQLQKSWYLFFFQVPRIPEWYLQRNDYHFLVNVMRGGARPGTFSDPDFKRYRQAWAEERALRAMINWYRALFRHSEHPPHEQVQAPTLIVWGENDQALVPEMAPKSIGYCEDGTLELISNASHWLPHESPERVADMLLNHLGS